MKSTATKTVARSTAKSKDAVAARAARANGNGAHLNGDAPTELHELLAAMVAMRSGDFTVRMAGHHTGVLGKIADTFNEIVSANERVAQQLQLIGNVVGRE